MVVDTLENLEKYASLNPLFAQAIEFLKSHDLQAMVDFSKRFSFLQEKRLELSWYCYHTDLNRTRLPIPPFLHLSFRVQHYVSVVRC